mmetsp:Transcript_17986/g.58847  ORF Transcript_17986/g.58847 Transcript_17986/m.58847 type:complete len:220 (-) Transcript_17986:90-749(-)
MIDRLGDQVALRQHLDEVPIRILHKCKALHAARVGCLAELTPELREPRARLVDVRDSDPEMAEAAAHLLPVLRAGGVSVARIVHRALLRLGPVVPGQLNAAGGAHAEGKAVVGVGRDAGRIDWCHKIDVEAPLRELPVHHQVEAEHVAVEGKRGLRVLHAQHCLLHQEILGCVRARLGVITRDIGHGDAHHWRPRGGDALVQDRDQCCVRRSERRSLVK